MANARKISLLILETYRKYVSKTKIVNVIFLYVYIPLNYALQHFIVTKQISILSTR